MKHLKKFEGLSDEHYQEIDALEFRDPDLQEKLEPLTTKELRDLDDISKKISSKFGVRVIAQMGSTSFPDVPESHFWFVFRPSEPGQRTTIELFKIDDDYFYVKIYRLERDSPAMSRSMVNHYRCDQFSGLVRLFEDCGLI